jgi:hypothetical protein
MTQMIDSDTGENVGNRPTTGRRAPTTRIRRIRFRRCTVSPAGAQVYGSRDGETESKHLDSEKEVAMKPERSHAQDFDAIGADPRDQARTQDLGSHRNEAADETRRVSGITAWTRPMQTETTAGTRAGLAACQGL